MRMSFYYALDSKSVSTSNSPPNQNGNRWTSGRRYRELIIPPHFLTPGPPVRHCRCLPHIAIDRFQVGVLWYIHHRGSATAMVGVAILPVLGGLVFVFLNV